MCIGVLTFYFTTTPYYERLKEKKVLFNLAVILSAVTIFAYADLANIFLITTPILILGCYDGASWVNAVLNRRIFRNFGKFSYAVYLNHALVARFVQARLIPGAQARGIGLTQWQSGGIFFVLLTAYSVLTLFLVETWKNKRRNKAAVQ